MAERPPGLPRGGRAFGTVVEERTLKTIQDFNLVLAAAGGGMTGWSVP